MKTYKVKTYSGTTKTNVVADNWALNDDGTLQFFDEWDELIHMWAPGLWNEVEVMPDAAQAVGTDG